MKRALATALGAITAPAPLGCAGLSVADRRQPADFEAKDRSTTADHRLGAPESQTRVLPLTASRTRARSNAEAPPSDPQASNVWRHIGTAPRTIAESGLPLTLLEDLVLKVLRIRERPTFTEITRVLCLHPLLSQDIIDGLVRRKLTAAESADSIMRGHFRYGLTEEGKVQADDALRRSAYVGAAPVPVDVYTRVVTAQRKTKGRPSPDDVRRALAHLVLPETTVAVTRSGLRIRGLL